MTLRFGSGRRSGALANGAAFLCLVVLAACSTVPSRHVSAPQGANDLTRVMYVVRRGWHVDVGFSAEDLTPELASTAPATVAPRFVLFGFGDRRYLLARHKRIDGLMAILRPGPRLLLVSVLDDPPREAMPAAAVVAIPVTAVQLAAAEAAVVSSFSATEAGMVAAGPYGASEYRAAAQRYSALHTCNTWAAEILHAAGLPVRSTGTLFATQLWLQVKVLERSR